MKITDEMVENGAIAGAIIDTIGTYGKLSRDAVAMIVATLMQEDEWAHTLAKTKAIVEAALDSGVSE